MIDTNALRKKVLDLAIRGMLTDQRPEDGNAEDLFKEIQLEKAKLIKEGKIKKEKALPSIDLKDIPFDIPANWKWVRLGDVCTVFGRIGFRGYTKQDIVDEGKGAISISPSNIIENGGMDFSKCTFISWEKYYESPEIMVEVGDVLVVKTGSSYGKVCVVKKLPSKATLNPQLVVLKNLFCNKFFIETVLRSPYAISKYENFVLGTTIPTFSQDNLRNCYFPLPPICEQQRIVEKLDSIFSLLAEIDEMQAKLSYNASTLRSSLLQLAMQGKLTEQLPEDGNAEDLFKEIQAEKARLIKEGKIKKEKALPPIDHKDIPFDIPANWKWVTLGSIFDMQSGKNITAKDIAVSFSDESPFPCYGGNGIRGYVSHYNRKGEHVLIGRQGALCGNVTFVDSLFYATEHAVVVSLFSGCNVMWAYYFLFALNLNQYATATAQPGLAVSKILSVLIPLPPLAEQARIVDKLNKALSFCDAIGN